MQVLRNFVFFILPFLVLARASHVPLPGRRHSPNLNINNATALGPRTDNARLSFYYITRGGSEVACGGFYHDSDRVVALNYGQWDGGAHCGKQVSITWQGKTATATIVDQCPAPCPYGALDLTVDFFTWFAGSIGPGLLWDASWDYVDTKPPPPTSKEPPPTSSKPPPPKTTSNPPKTSETSTTKASETESSTSSSSSSSHPSPSASESASSSLAPTSSSTSAPATPTVQHAISNLILSYAQIAALDAVGSHSD